MDQSEESLFEDALNRYKAGSPADELIEDFQKITSNTPNNAAAWTCLSWLQLLCDAPQEALRSARYAVKLNGQDPQSRINLSLALLETNSKGVRDHIDYVKRAATYRIFINFIIFLNIISRHKVHCVTHTTASS